MTRSESSSDNLIDRYTPVPKERSRRRQSRWPPQGPQGQQLDVSNTTCQEPICPYMYCVVISVLLDPRRGSSLLFFMFVRAQPYTCLGIVNASHPCSVYIYPQNSMLITTVASTRPGARHPHTNSLFCTLYCLFRRTQCGRPDSLTQGWLHLILAFTDVGSASFFSRDVASLAPCSAGANGHLRTRLWRNRKKSAPKRMYANDISSIGVLPEKT